MSDDIKTLTDELGKLNSQLSDLQSRREGVDDKISKAIEPYMSEKESINSAIDSVSASVKELSERLAKFELEEAAREIENAEKDAIESVRRYNKLYLRLRDGGKVEDYQYGKGVMALVKTDGPASEHDGGDKAWLSAYNVYVVEYENCWFPSELNC